MLDAQVTIALEQTLESTQDRSSCTKNPSHTNSQCEIKNSRWFLRTYTYIAHSEVILFEIRHNTTMDDAKLHKELSVCAGYCC